MNELVILVVEDEPEVRAALLRDLEPLRPAARIVEAASVPDAHDALAEIVEDGDRLALVLADHLLPGETGVDLLVALAASPATAAGKRVLVTGQAGHADTIRAVNEADLDHYIAKPWSPDELVQVSIEALTDFVLEQRLDPLPYVQYLDAPRLLEAYAKRASDR